MRERFIIFTVAQKVNHCQEELSLNRIENRQRG